jgi:glycosyltransferase involved in cell wall biosynthesis
VVTIHDLIFKRHPQWYKAVDAKIYDKKFKYAATYADVVIAVSKQTAKDIVEIYNVNPDKIKVVYQSCNPVFFNLLSPETVEQIKAKEKLPSTYLLYVGTIEERKNLHNLVLALAITNTEIPLVVIGRKTEYYFKIVEPLIQKYNLTNKIHFIQKIDNKELPGIYQGAKLFIYPSLYEGFGIPILESLASGTPVITSAGGCFHESAGTHSIFVDSNSSEALAHAISELLADKEKRITMIEEGRKYARLFTDKSSAENLMKIYEQLI